MSYNSFFVTFLLIVSQILFDGVLVFGGKNGASNDHKSSNGQAKEKSAAVTNTELTNVTSIVFGNEDLSFLPLAFGDFNADKLTDLIVMTPDRSKIAVLLARQESILDFSHLGTHDETDNYFNHDPVTLNSHHLQCSFDGRELVHAIPGDFDGDGGLDIFVIYHQFTSRQTVGFDMADFSITEDGSDSSDDLVGVVLWGNHNVQGKHMHTLLCPEDSLEKGWHHKLRLGDHVQPILLDSNGDSVADLFGVAFLPSREHSKDAVRGIWQFEKNGRHLPPHFRQITVESDALRETLETPMRFPHSNAYVDLNEDGNADLFITSVNAFELWQFNSSHSLNNLSLHNSVNIKDIDVFDHNKKCSGKRTLGQSAFTDFDLDGHLDMLFLINCDSNSLLVTIKVQDLWEGKVDKFRVVSVSGMSGWNEIDGSEYAYDFVFDTINSNSAVQPLNYFYPSTTLHVGDVNLDGYPDILVRMKNLKIPDESSMSNNQMHLLLNFGKSMVQQSSVSKTKKSTKQDESESNSDRSTEKYADKVYSDGAKETPKPLMKQRPQSFRLSETYMHSLRDIKVATFYDLWEDGINDLITVSMPDSSFNGGENDFPWSSARIGAWTNATKSSDAYFVKVIVLTGACYKNCESHLKIASSPSYTTDTAANGERERGKSDRGREKVDYFISNTILKSVDVPYGTNMPGQTVCYETQRPLSVAESIEQKGTFGKIHSCSSQLSQSSHQALQLPYTIFGLGLAPNFVDFISVHVSNATHPPRSKFFPQIIPNSQLYVIPHPTDIPSSWSVKLFITPGTSITLTALVLILTCVLSSLIIVMLHVKERKQDLIDKQKDGHRFHFDAM